jgi:hypothetical protein
MIDTKSFVMSTKKPRPWRNLTFNMLPFGLSGIHLKLQATTSLTSSIIGSTFSTFMCDNGEASCYM